MLFISTLNLDPNPDLSYSVRVIFYSITQVYETGRVGGGGGEGGHSAPPKKKKKKKKKIQCNNSGKFWAKFWQNLGSIPGKIQVTSFFLFSFHGWRGFRQSGPKIHVGVLPQLTGPIRLCSITTYPFLPPPPPPHGSWLAPSPAA